jgi:hypothetical protein
MLFQKIRPYRNELYFWRGRSEVYVSKLLADNGSAHLDDQFRNAINTTIVEDVMTADMIRRHYVIASEITKIRFRCRLLRLIGTRFCFIYLSAKAGAPVVARRAAENGSSETEEVRTMARPEG